MDQLAKLNSFPKSTLPVFFPSPRFSTKAIIRSTFLVLPPICQTGNVNLGRYAPDKWEQSGFLAFLSHSGVNLGNIVFNLQRPGYTTDHIFKKTTLFTSVKGTLIEGSVYIQRGSRISTSPICMTKHMMTSFRTFHLHELCRADFRHEISTRKEGRTRRP